MMKTKTSRVLILGTTIESAGIGGVTIHIQRLCQWLEREGYPFDFCDYKSVPILRQIKEISAHEVFHIHASNPYLRLFYILLGKVLRVRTILTVHGDLGRHSRMKNCFDKLSVRMCDCPVLINKHSYHIALKSNENSIYISAFIPPVSEGYLPESVERVIQTAKKNGLTIVATNASVMSFSDDGNEIYGIHFLVEYFRSRPGYFLCVSDPSSQYSTHYGGSAFENVIFITENHSFYHLLELSDILIRATVTDGDSLSIKEGLFLKKTVLATDCVDRPEGVILFHYNDSVSLGKALSEKVLSSCLKDEDVVDAIKELYNKLIH